MTAKRRSARELRARREELRRRTRRRRQRTAVLALALLAAAGLAAALVDSAPLGGLRGAPDAEAADEVSPAAQPRSSLVKKRQANRRQRAEALRRARVEIVAVGDIALNGTPPPALLAGAATLLRGDIVVGNLEGTLATGGESKCARAAAAEKEKRKKDGKREPGPPTCFAFRAPPAYAAELRRAGLTVLNVANNHSADYGWTGQTETAAALTDAGLGVTGLGPEPYVRKVGRVRVAVLGFAPRMPGWELLDVTAAAENVRRAARRADVVVVTMHAGAEGADANRVRPGMEWYLGEPRGDVAAFARAVLRAGADLVVGHGPHVLRGLEWRRGRLVAYSLGNFAGTGELNLNGPGAVSAGLRVTLRGDGSWVDGALVPVRLAHPGAPALDPAGEALTAVRQLSRADFGGRAPHIDAEGRITARGRR